MNKTGARLSTTLTAVLMAGGLTLVSSTPAEAIGGNRTAVRGCGTNKIWSYYDDKSTGHAWAKTQKLSGNCGGPLYADLQDKFTGILEWSTGYTLAQTANYVHIGTAGYHKGCGSCSISAT